MQSSTALLNQAPNPPAMKNAAEWQRIAGGFFFLRTEGLPYNIHMGKMKNGKVKIKWVMLTVDQSIQIRNRY